MISILDVVILLLKSLTPAVTTAKWPVETITAIESILAQVEAVKGQIVTYGQLESLRVEPEWGEK